MAQSFKFQKKRLYKNVMPENYTCTSLKHISLLIDRILSKIDFHLHRGETLTVTNRVGICLHWFTNTIRYLLVDLLRYRQDIS